MERPSAILLLLATLAFVASTLAFLLQPVATGTAGEVTLLPGFPLGDAVSVVPDLVTQLLRPRIPAMAALLVATWLALLYHAIRNILETSTEAPAPGTPPIEHGLQMIGLVAGAVWPWLIAEQPGGAFLLGALMVIGIVGEALAGSGPRSARRISTSLSFVAGWCTLTGAALCATLLQKQFGTPAGISAVLAITGAALATVSLQLRLGRTISYGIAVIWGMIGLAAGAVATQASLSMMAVLGIAIIAVAMVRVTT